MHGGSVSTYKATAALQIAEVYAFRGEADAAFVWLDRAYVQRDAGRTFRKGDPLLASLERDLGSKAKSETKE